VHKKRDRSLFKQKENHNNLSLFQLVVTVLLSFVGDSKSNLINALKKQAE